MSLLNLGNFLDSMGKNSMQKRIFIFLISVWIVSIPFKNAVYQISVSLVILYFLIYIAMYRNFAPLRINLQKCVLPTVGFVLMIISMVISNLLNPEFLADKSWHVTAMFVVRYTLVFIILAYFYSLGFFSKKEIILAVFASFLLLSFTAIFQICTNPSGMFNPRVGLTGSLGHHNALGLSMGLAVSSAIALFSCCKKISLVLVLYFAFFMIFSFSRSAWVASFVAGVCFIILNFKNFTISDKKILFLFMLVLIALLAVLFIEFDSFKERFDTLLAGDSSNRYLIWDYSWHRILEHPIFGWGIDSFRNLPGSVVHISEDMNSTHNMILEILIYTGIVGFIVSLFTIVCIFTRLLKNVALLVLGIHFLVVTQFDFSVYATKELLSYITILVFLAYADDFKSVKFKEKSQFSKDAIGSM